MLDSQLDAEGVDDLRRVEELAIDGHHVQPRRDLGDGPGPHRLLLMLAQLLSEALRRLEAEQRGQRGGPQVGLDEQHLGAAVLGHREGHVGRADALAVAIFGAGD